MGQETSHQPKTSHSHPRMDRNRLRPAGRGCGLR